MTTPTRIFKSKFLALAAGLLAASTMAGAQDSTPELEAWLQGVAGGDTPGAAQALALAEYEDTARLAELANQLRDRGHGNVVSYSRKVFIPLTHLCRDVCHYCTFAQTPRHLPAP